MSPAEPNFFAAIFSIIVIDLALAGDNAVVIAMAARTLPAQSRRKAIFFGALAAVVVRVALTFFVSQLLQVQFVKLVGGLVILWVAVKLFTTGGGEGEHSVKSGASVWEAVKIIVVADISMGVDNMLAVGGASEGHLGLLIFGLGLSIPFLVFASDFLSRIMDRYPIIIYIGAAILGRVAGNMIMTDPKVTSMFGPPKWLVWTVEATLAIAIIAFGYVTSKKRKREREQQAIPAAAASDAHH